MASARQKGGKWYYRITVTNGSNSHKYIERGSYRTKKEALDAGKKAEIALKEGVDLERRKFMSFSFLADEWLEESRTKYKETTIYDYKKQMRLYILPILSDYNLSAISYRLCQKVIDQLVADHHSKHLLTNVKGTMNQCFKYAIRCGYMTSNPAKDVSLPEPRTRAAMMLRSTRQSKVVSHQMIHAIFKRFPEGHTDYIPLLLGYRCGLRLGEAFGVFIDDIDFKKKQIHIRRQVQYDTERATHYFTAPKYCLPGQGRDVDVDDETLAILKRHVTKLLDIYRPMNFPAYYLDDNDRLTTEPTKRQVFPINVRFTDGTYISPNTIHHVGRVIHGKDGKIDLVDADWDFHALRHTHASECLAAGMSIVSVQNRLGHKNLQTTYRYYIHETEDQATESRDILGRMYS